MYSRQLSRREAEIVDLSIQGLANDAIAHRLGISIGTVNTYWLRIRMKVGGAGRTDSVAKVIQDRAARALSELDAQEDRTVIIDQKAHSLLELRASVALLSLMVSQIKSMVWAADQELNVSIIANGELPTTEAGAEPVEIKTVYDIFRSQDPAYPPIAAHIRALAGVETTNLVLEGEFTNMKLRVAPIADTEEGIIGCIGILKVIDAHEF